ncbi:S-layer homology domain-containing protein [Paenibacillus sp. HJGM_3]|uniref:S-layer homology domain-containing protein n=1 Tax=Paenibacillus sp. HJGM_3 TaxID=3379816 RepID=UPI00385D3E24
MRSMFRLLFRLKLQLLLAFVLAVPPIAMAGTASAETNSTATFAGELLASCEYKSDVDTMSTTSSCPDTISIGTDAGYSYISVLKFGLSGFAGTVLEADLELFVNEHYANAEGSPELTVYQHIGSWTKPALNSEAPAVRPIYGNLQSRTFALSGQEGQWKKFNIAPLVRDSIAKGEDELVLVLEGSWAEAPDKRLFRFLTSGSSAPKLNIAYTASPVQLPIPHTRIAAGDGFTLSLQDDGTVKAYGWINGHKIQVPDSLTGVQAVYASNVCGYAIKANGSVAALGEGCTVPAEVPATGVVGLVLDGYASAALKSDGTTINWGSYAFPEEWRSIHAPFKSIAGGNSHASALTWDHDVVSWGAGSMGQTSVPVDLPETTAIASGINHTLALLSDGTVRWWGPYYLERIPEHLSDVVAIDANDNYSVALKRDGHLVVWGDGGQLQPPPGLDGVVAIAAGRSHLIALKSDGTLVGWGNNRHGETVTPAPAFGGLSWSPVSENGKTTARIAEGYLQDERYGELTLKYRIGDAGSIRQPYVGENPSDLGYDTELQPDEALAVSPGQHIYVVAEYEQDGDKKIAYWSDVTVSPAYTGPLSWNHYSAPRNTSIVPAPGTYTYNLYALDIDDHDAVYTVGQRSTTGLSTITGVVEKISDNGQKVEDITYNSGLTNPRGIAVDKDGNIYVTDNSSLSSSNNVVKIMMLPHGTESWVPITYGQTFRFALGIAADNQGNVFFGEYSGVNNPTPPSGNIFMLPNGGNTWLNINGGTSFYIPWDLAADSKGNVFVSDSSPVNGISIIQKRPPGPPIPAQGNSWTNVAPAAGQGNSFSANGISVDKFDNLYAMGGGIKKLKYNGGQTDWTSIATISNSITSIGLDAAADSSGYLYLTNLGYGNVSKLMASVIYNANGGGGTVPVDPVGYKPYGSAIVAGAGSLVKPGYLFEGWATTSNATVPEYVSGDSITLTQSVTLYAVWSPALTITYNGNGNTGGSVPIDPGHKSGVTAVVYGNTGNLVKTGHVFDGWKTTSGTVTGITYAPGDTLTMTQNITLYANWTPVSTISYNGNGNTGGTVPVDSGSYRQGETATVYGNTGNLVKTYHTFGGWTTGTGVTEATYAPGDTFTITDPVIFYAKWIESSAFTVTYQAGTGGNLNGSVGSVTESVYSGGFPVSVPTATPELGNTFLGWSQDGGATLLTSDQLAATVVTGDITYTAYFMLPVTLSNLILDSAGYTLEPGSTHQTVTTAVYSDNSTFTLSSGVTYSSSSAAVASVNSSGLVTALSDGQTVITAVYGGKQAQAIVTVHTPESSGGGGGSTPAKPGVEIIVDGVRQDQLATAERKTVNGQSVTTVTLDSKKVTEKLEKENNKLITIPVSGDSDVAVGQLNASLVKSMQSKDAQIQIVTDKAVYTLPASQINIDSISTQVGAGVKLEDITIRIQISETPKDKAAQVEGAAKQNQYTLVGAPVDFEVTASYGTQTVLANQFNSYVERKIVLPDGTDARDLTTGVVLTENRTLSHVPTMVVKENGKTYAIINSLTNSTYSVVYSPREMDDVKRHWAQADVNDMSSRLIVNGVTATEFRPDASITRAEFAAIVTRGLGIQEAEYADSFSDVTINSWYARTVQAAIHYKLIDGYEDGTFRPDQNISRQEATAVLARAAKIAKLNSELPASEVTLVLSAFKDGSEVASWARTNVAAAISLNLMNGRGEKLEVDANLTRAETAALVRRLLQAAKLINP